MDIFKRLLTYSILSLALRSIYEREKDDLSCPHNTKDRSLCREGNGKVQSGLRPEIGDGPDSLFKKLEAGSRAWRKDVIWRRGFIIACLLCICVYVLILNRWPNPAETILFIFITTALIHFNHSWYNYHYYAHTEAYMLDCLNQLHTHHLNVLDNSKLISSPITKGKSGKKINRPLSKTVKS